MPDPPLRIVLCHRERVPVVKYGGTERVVMWLARALVERGHEVVLAVPEGSHAGDTGARLHPIPPKIVRKAFNRPGFEVAPHLPSGADIVHFHFFLAASGVGFPHVVTMHGNEDRAWGPEHCFLSRDHRDRWGGRHWVYNGIDPGPFRTRARREDFLLFLGDPGRSVKGVDRAEKIAKAAGRRLVIAGGWRINFSRKIRSVGSVDDRRKADLLARAAALVNPIRWPEPFGLVVAESWAAGCPVLASPLGSMPELFQTEGEPVGFLCDSDEAFVQALDRLGEIDPDACRAHVERRFTAGVMASNYERFYRRAISGDLQTPFVPEP